MARVEVEVKDNENFESALRRFKKECQKQGVISEIKRREHYDKPSVRRKKKLLAARRKNRQQRR